MRRFYILGFAPEDEAGNALEMAKCDLSNFELLRLKEGARIVQLPNGCSVRVKPRKKTDANVIINVHGLLIVSHELGTSFMKVARNDIELLPVPVLDNSGSLLRQDFSIVNVLRKLDAISERKTVRSPVSLGDVKPVLTLGLDASKVPENIHVFRVIGWDYPVVVDDLVKLALREVEHEGLVFIRVEQE